MLECICKYMYMYEVYDTSAAFKIRDNHIWVVVEAAAAVWPSGASLFLLYYRGRDRIADHGLMLIARVPYTSTIVAII